MNLKQQISHILLAPCLLAALMASAEELTTYQVEMMVFEQPLYEFTDNEIFQQGVLVPDTETAREIPLQKSQIGMKNTTVPPQSAENDITEKNTEKDIAVEELTPDNLVSPDPGLLKLEKIRQSIEKSSSYRLISYQSWQQMGQDDQHAFNIHIAAGFPFVVIYNANDNKKQNTMAVDYSELMDQWEIYKETLPIISNTNQIADTEAIEEQENTKQTIKLPDDLLSYLASLGKQAKIVYELDGTVKLVRTRFLHFYTNLVWNVQLDPTINLLADQPENAEEADKLSLVEDMETEEPVIASVLDQYNESENNKEESVKEDEFLSSLATLNIQSYPFISHRKMKSRQQHYIDHPKIGLIITVNPVPKTETKVQEDRDAEK